MTADLVTVILALVAIAWFFVILAALYCVARCALAVWGRCQRREQAWDEHVADAFGIALCGPCLGDHSGQCDGEAISGGPCMCAHSAMAPRLGGGR